MKIGVTSILGKTFQEQVNNDEIEMQPAADALGEVLPATGRLRRARAAGTRHE